MEGLESKVSSEIFSERSSLNWIPESKMFPSILFSFARDLRISPVITVFSSVLSSTSSLEVGLSGELK